MKKTIVTDNKLPALGIGIADEAAQIKERVVDAFAEGVNTAKAAARRANKRGHDVTEELLDNAARQVKRHPFQSVGLTLGVGLATGFVFGWLVARQGK